MALQKVLTYTETLEDPKHPLMGPTIKGLYLFGLWQTGTKFRTISYNCAHFSTFLFVLSEIVDLYQIRHDLNMVFNNMSLAVLSFICLIKCVSYVFHQRKWRDLIDQISIAELNQIRQQDKITFQLMKEYTKYTRVVTYLYWVMVFLTNLLLIVSPFIKFVSKSYREDVSSGKEPLPQILFSWLPFDNKKMPGYFGGILVQIFMGCQGSGVLAVYDTSAVAVMSYLKGQTIILREKCRRIFEGESTRDIVERIRECHELHNVLVRHHRMFNELLSPTMFLYVLVCSITICGSVVQLTSKDATPSQKLWTLEYTGGLVSQLFLYCWHSNEVAVETKSVERGIYESDWWKGDKTLRRLTLLLAGKLGPTLILDAGPYTTLSVPTFVEIIKGSYSFFTLFSQMQDDKMQ